MWVGGDMAKRGRKPKAKALAGRIAGPAPKAGEVLGKTPQEYYEAVKLPLAVLIAWSVIGFLAMLVSPWLGLITGPIGLLLGIVAPLYVGWTMVKRHAGDLLQALVAGVILGAITSAVNGALQVILVLISPTAFGAVVGAGVVAIGAVVGIIIGGIIAAILSLIGALAAKYI